MRMDKRRGDDRGTAGAVEKRKKSLRISVTTSAIDLSQKTTGCAANYGYYHEELCCIMGMHADIMGET